MINWIKNIDKNNGICLLISTFIVLRTINITINEIFVLSSNFSLLIKFTLLICFLVIDLCLFISMNIKEKKYFILSEVIIFVLMSITSIRYSSLGVSVFLSYSWLPLVFVPILNSMINLDDLDMLFEYLKNASYIVSFLCTLIYFFHIRSISTNLVFSYTLLLSYLIHLVLCIKERKIINIIITLFETYMMISYASRGTLICCLIFLVIIFMVKLGKNSLKYLLVILALAIIFYIVADKLGFFSYLYTYFLEQGRYVRMLDLLSKGQFFDNNGRFDIYVDYFNYILKHPIFGNGIGADLFVGIFPHNVFIEVIFNFGIFSLYIFYKVFVFIKEYFNYFFSLDKNYLFFVLLCSGVVPLMFSSTYLEWLYFWIFIGFLMSIHSNYKNEK